MNKLSKPRPEIITITDRALARMKYILEKAPKNTLGIRFGIKTGGCSGMTYDVNYASEEKLTDEKVVKDNINILSLIHI